MPARLQALDHIVDSALATIAANARQEEIQTVEPSGTILYITAMWVSGIGQGLMLRAFDEYGNLAYTFVETVAFMHGPLAARAIGGMFFVSGMLIMAYNIYMTIARAKQEEKVSAIAAAKA